jgi:DNA topoisomerase-2
MKLIKKSITDHINKDYREYAIYSLESRGIPSFVDSLTPVQRYILQNAPTTFIKTLKLVGDCISDDYHHGDASLSNAINNLTRPILCSNQILEGDGFFGNSINHDPASPRYTSVKINPKIKEHLKKYNFLNVKIKDGGWKPLKVDVPFGLCSLTNGIAVGFSCSILPRKLEDIVDFLNGKKKTVPPFFMNFKGKIVKNDEKENRSSWIIEPLIEIDKNKKIIKVLDISPTIQYSSYIEKINLLIEKYNCKYQNNTRDCLDLVLDFSKVVCNFDDVVKHINKISTTTFTENINFIKDGGVLEYENIEDYLLDFKGYREFLYLERYEWEYIESNETLNFLKAKKEYLVYMLGKKRTVDEIETFLNKYPPQIYDRLDNIKLRNLNPTYLEEVILDISKIEEDIKNKKNIIQKQKQVCTELGNYITKAKVSSIKK